MKDKPKNLKTHLLTPTQRRDVVLVQEAVIAGKTVSRADKRRALRASRTVTPQSSMEGINNAILAMQIGVAEKAAVEAEKATVGVEQVLDASPQG